MKSISNYLFNTDYLILYRLIVIILYTISSQIGYFYFYPNNNEGIQLIQVLYLLKFFTCITMTLNAIYFITSIPLQYFNLDHIRGYQFLVVFSFNSVRLYQYHLIPPVALVLDAYLCHPKIVSFYKALKIECFIGIIYNIFIETGILLWNTSPYPQFLKYNLLLRYFNYTITWSISIGFILLGEKFVHYLHKSIKKKIKEINSHDDLKEKPLKTKKK
ncbi:uncharacterized protein DC041_0007357 [Schistosoma bovis]|uniref:Uncharacterized protein n=1 Tax=Schistosoma bovis TaxID=6184 RepID=A0A430Q0Z7_SCHBO|nr:uncharacterized protein DC041_0007357 [Schistosoma bovis]